MGYWDIKGPSKIFSLVKKRQQELLKLQISICSSIYCWSFDYLFIWPFQNHERTGISVSVYDPPYCSVSEAFVEFRVEIVEISSKIQRDNIDIGDTDIVLEDKHIVHVNLQSKARTTGLLLATPCYSFPGLRSKLKPSAECRLLVLVWNINHCNRESNIIMGTAQILFNFFQPTP